MDERQDLVDAANGAKVRDGTYYPLEMNEDAVQALEVARKRGGRIRIHLGDTATGRDWLEKYDCEGSVSRTMGPRKAPILLNNARSMGGGIISASIVRIRWTGAKGRDLYRHPLYHVPPVEIRDCAGEWSARVYVGGGDCAGFKTRQRAERWVKRVLGPQVGEGIVAYAS